MIDWITAIVPCFHEKPLDSGRITKINSSGEVEGNLLPLFPLLVAMIHH